jgi:hypothetical protein
MSVKFHRAIEDVFDAQPIWRSDFHGSAILPRGGLNAAAARRTCAGRRRGRPRESRDRRIGWSPPPAGRHITRLEAPPAAESCWHARDEIGRQARDDLTGPRRVL